MLIGLITDGGPGSSAFSNPSSENLMMLIIITGGLLFICILLLIIVMLRTKAKRKKLAKTLNPLVQESETPKEESKTEVAPKIEKLPETKPEPVKKVVEVEVKKPVAPVVETKKIVEEKKIVPPPPVVTTIKEEPKEEKKVPEIKPLVETKKPDVVIIKTEPVDKTPDKKPEVKIANTSIEQKKEEFRKALAETHSKEDNLKVLQERLAELSKEKKTTVTFIEAEKKDPEKKTLVEQPEKKDENKPAEHTKLVDLTALINEKLQTKTEKQVEKPEVKTQPFTEVKKDVPPVIKETKEEESHKILTPFLDKMKSNPEMIEETPESIVNSIDEEIKSIAENKVVDEEIKAEIEQKQKTKEEAPTVNPTTTDPNPKTFTEWLNTLKK